MHVAALGVLLKPIGGDVHAERVDEYAEAGITLLLIQSSPLDEELDEQVFPLIEQRALATLRG